MDFVEPVLARLASAKSWGYHDGSETATEPTALAALALMAHGRAREARPKLEWLLARQSADGSVGVDAAQDTPGWATGWSVLAWKAAQENSVADSRFGQAIQRAVTWMLGVQGSIVEHVDLFGHDSTIKGWPWVVGTHAWVEPTAMNLLALRHTGHGSHERANEAVRLLHDRLLDAGGCNYGNTIVFDQALRPHLEPTGICLLALADKPDAKGRVEKSLAYAADVLEPRTTSASLSYALLGLAAHGRYPADAQELLEHAASRTLRRDASPYKLALLALAALGEGCPLIPRFTAAKA
jgi:hypothetical protein